MSSFLVTHNGEQQGPFNQSEIIELLNQEQLSWKDHLYDESLGSWLYIMEHPLFTTQFNSSFADSLKIKQQNQQIEDVKKRQWFVLKENTNYGPFSKLELLQMLQGKTLFEYDFIWKEDMSSWKKVSDLSEFSIQNIRNIHLLSKVPFEKDLNKIFFRRKFARVKAENRVIVHDQKKIYNCMSNEISEGGVSFNAENHIFKIEQQLYLHFIAGEGLPQFNAIGKVVSQRGSLIGVQFVSIPGVAKNFISKLSLDYQKVG